MTQNDSHDGFLIERNVEENWHEAEHLDGEVICIKSLIVAPVPTHLQTWKLIPQKFEVNIQMNLNKQCYSRDPN